MTPLRIIYPAGLGVVMSFAAVILMIGQLFNTIHAIHQYRSRYAVVANILLAVGNLVLLIFLLDFIFRLPKYKAHYYSEAVLRFYELPWGAVLFMELLSSGFILLSLYNNVRYGRLHVTPGAVKETIDLLPAGVCFANQKGVPVIVNLKMHEFSRLLTGSRLTDTGLFRELIRKMGKEQNGQFLVSCPDGTVFLWAESEILLEGRRYDQMTATDVTEPFRITRELQDKNEKLLDIQKRIRMVSELSGDMFVAEEESQARAALHNQMGQVLLAGRHFLEHPESSDARFIYLATQQMNAFLLGEAESMDNQELENVEMAVKMAHNIGVTVLLKGEIPEEETVQTFLSLAIRECAANTVKHAGGDQVRVKVYGEGERIRVRITNNGASPKAEVTESGGLLSLRRQVEKAGGFMKVESFPAFALELMLRRTVPGEGEELWQQEKR